MIFTFGLNYASINDYKILLILKITSHVAVKFNKDFFNQEYEIRNYFTSFDYGL